MVDGRGYWGYAKVPFNLNFASNQEPTWGGLVGAVIPPASPPPSYSLVAGWNLLGFKPQPDPTANENVATYLNSITGSYDTNSVWIYDNVSRGWFRADATYSLQPGQAIWVLVVTPATVKP